MSLNPSNSISEQITKRTTFVNVAGLGKRDPRGVDAILSAELEAAGVEVVSFEIFRNGSGEPQSSIVGQLGMWSFRRASYYWMATGPGIPPEDATRLHAAFGTSVRVDGHCGCPSPAEWFKGFAVGAYHVDDQEGLDALADTIRSIYRRNAQYVRPEFLAKILKGGGK